ncbi:hypothetical protein T265_10538 [Opisthorchis viverrini]|uniref:Uncharacterized protein n=1 Tax=Opisthorchis viverrini TaxID=6198 RepID=A0A074Z241_OPIVI|nr:hypothetical protein T265_10538 [Opisthorchis viverrini]KER21053.1 hypothetical protein T265_10538 [Opisthorchis viverrini]
MQTTRAVRIGGSNPGSTVSFSGSVETCDRNREPQSNQTEAADVNSRRRLSTDVVFTIKDIQNILHKINAFRALRPDQVHPGILEKTSSTFQKSLIPLLTDRDPFSVRKVAIVPPICKADDRIAYELQTVRGDGMHSDASYHKSLYSQQLDMSDPIIISPEPYFRPQHARVCRQPSVETDVTHLSCRNLRELSGNTRGIQEFVAQTLIYEKSTMRLYILKIRRHAEIAFSSDPFLYGEENETSEEEKKKNGEREYVEHEISWEKRDE